MNQEAEQSLPQGKFQKQMPTETLSYDQRSCTDVCCIIIGFVFTITILTIALLSANHQHQSQISLPSDSSGSVCGIDLPKYSFLYFTNPPEITNRVCVSSCPKPGSVQMDCKATGDIGCKFNSIPGFEVVYYDNEPVIDNNGNFCMPTDPELRQKISENGNLDSRLVFFNSYNVLVLCILVAIGLSAVYTVIVHWSPRKMMWITIILSLIVLVGLSVAVFLYKSEHPGKILIGSLLAALFLIISLSVYLYQQSIRVGAVYLREGTKFTASKPSTAFYIVLFAGCSLGFFVMLIKEYTGLIGVGTPTFSNESLYYEVNKKGMWLVWVVLGIQLLWGLSFLKEAFNFCISHHAVLHYLKKGGGICSIGETLSLLVFKHLGTVIAAAFINIFFFIPDLILDFFRLNKSTKEESCTDGCLKFFDLVRSDALAYTALTGLSYCNSAKYCEYFNHQSFQIQSTQSVMRLYRICAHMLIAGTVSLLGLFIKGQIQAYTVAATFIIGMFVSTYIISFQADPADALHLMYNIEQEFHRRTTKKQQVNLFNEEQKKTHQKWLLDIVGKKDSQFVEEVKLSQIEAEVKTVS